MKGKKKGSAKSSPVESGNPSTRLPAAIRTGLWAPWGYKPADKEGGKPAKVPVAVSEWGVPSFLSITAPERWTDHATAAQAFEKIGGPMKDRRTGEVLWTKAGLGRLCESEPELTVLDVDNCIDAKGKLNAAAADIVKRAATYTEVSPSGKGLRLAFTGAKPEALRTSEVGTINGTRVECYDAASTRYVTFTGNTLPDTKAGVAAMPKGFAKWFAENWKRGGGGVARGSMRLVNEATLAEVQDGYAGKAGTPTVKFDPSRFLVVKGNGAELDRSAAFASVFSRFYGGENSTAEVMAAALGVVGDMADKGVRKVVVFETGEILRVPFAVADAAGLAYLLDERAAVKRGLENTLPKLDASAKLAVVRKFHAEYPQHAWQVAHGAIKSRVPLMEVEGIVGEQTMHSVAEYLQRKRESAGGAQ